MSERRPKRQRYSSETASNDTEATNNYAQYLIDNHLQQANRQSHPLSFGSTKQPQRNEAQQSVYEQFLHVCVAIFLIFLVNNCVFLPGSYFANAIDTTHKILTIDNQNSHIYWILGKIGSAGCGAIRLAEYIKKYKELSLACPPIFSMIDLDNLPEWVQSEVTKQLLIALSGFIPRVFPVTIRDCLRDEMVGLPIFTQLWFWSMSKSTEACKILGGACDLKSHFRRLVLHVTESGAQEHMKEEGNVEMRTGTDQHELCNGSWTGRFLVINRSINNDAQEFLHSHSPHEQRQLDEFDEEDDYFHNRSTWGPGQMKGQENHVFATLALMDVVSGLDNFADSMAAPPVHNPTSLAECYASEKYGRDDLLVGVFNKFGGFDYLEEHGGIWLGDEDETVMSVVSMTVVEVILARRPCGENGPKWYVRHRFKLITVLKLDLDDGLIREAFIYCSPCNMLWWKPGVTIGWKKIREMEETAASIQWLNVVINKIRSDDDDFNLTIDKSLDAPIEGNIYFGWTLFAHLHTVVHLSDDMCSHTFKNFIMYANDNINRPGRNGFRKSGHCDGETDISETLSRNTRRHLTNPNEYQARSDRAYEQNRNINREIVSSLSRTRTESQVSERIADVLDMCSVVSTRRTQFGKSGLVTDSQVLAGIDALYEEDKPNSGNTSENHRSATKNEVVDANIQLSPLVESGGYFWLQHLGVAGMSKDDKTQPMVFPASGTVMGRGAVYKVKDENDRVVKKQIKYLTDPPAPFVSGISYLSACGRFGKKGPTKQKGTAEYYPNHNIRRVAGANLGRAQFVEKSKKTKANTPPELLFCEHNLMLCYVVPKPKPK